MFVLCCYVIGGCGGGGALLEPICHFFSYAMYMYNVLYIRTCTCIHVCNYIQCVMFLVYIHASIYMYMYMHVLYIHVYVHCRFHSIVESGADSQTEGTGSES